MIEDRDLRPLSDICRALMAQHNLRVSEFARLLQTRRVIAQRCLDGGSVPSIVEETARTLTANPGLVEPLRITLQTARKIGGGVVGVSGLKPPVLPDDLSGCSVGDLRHFQKSLVERRSKARARGRVDMADRLAAELARVREERATRPRIRESLPADPLACCPDDLNRWISALCSRRTIARRVGRSADAAFLSADLARLRMIRNMRQSGQ